jgi:hypothetical protein
MRHIFEAAKSSEGRQCRHCDASRSAHYDNNTPPKRIWVDTETRLSWGAGFWHLEEREGDIDYLRADLAMLGGKEIVEHVAAKFPHFLTAVNPLAIQMLINEINAQIATEIRVQNAC